MTEIQSVTNAGNINKAYGNINMYSTPESSVQKKDRLKNMLKHDLSLNMKKRLDKEIGVLHNNDRHVANRVSCDNPMYNLNSVNKGNYASCKLD